MIDFNLGIPDKISRVRITGEALGKAQDIACLVAELMREPLEISLYMTNYNLLQKRQDIAVRDIVIAKNQVISPWNCAASGAGQEYTEQDIKNSGSVVVGWAHSHGKFPNVPTLWGLDKSEGKDRKAFQDFVDTNKQIYVDDSGVCFYYSLGLIVNSLKQNPCFILAYQKEKYTPVKILHGIEHVILDESNGIVRNRDVLEAEIHERVRRLSIAETPVKKDTQKILSQPNTPNEELEKAYAIYLNLQEIKGNRYLYGATHLLGGLSKIRAEQGAKIDVNMAYLIETCDPRDLQLRQELHQVYERILNLGRTIEKSILGA